MNSGKGITRKRPWLYHPLEFGVTGDVAGREVLSARLAHALGPETRLLCAQGTLDPDVGAWTCLDAGSVLVDAPPPGLVLPRLHVLGPRAPREVLAAGREAPPVVVAGEGARPRRLPWGVPWFHRDDVEGLADFIRGYWESQIANRPLLGLVLAGGRGGALGFDKAQLVYGGNSQIERAFELLSRFCDQTWVSCRKDQSDSPARSGWPQIHDRYLDRGPLGGILSALDHRPEAAWLVVACDQPYLDEPTLEVLLSQRDPRAFATSFRGSDGLPEPLCTVYEPKARLGLLNTWALGYSCPRKLLTGSHCLIVDPPSLPCLADINTPREDEEAKRTLN